MILGKACVRPSFVRREAACVFLFWERGHSSHHSRDHVAAGFSILSPELVLRYWGSRVLLFRVFNEGVRGWEYARTLAAQPPLQLCFRVVSWSHADAKESVQGIDIVSDRQGTQSGGDLGGLHRSSDSVHAALKGENIAINSCFSFFGELQKWRSRCRLPVRRSSCVGCFWDDMVDMEGAGL